MLRLPHHLIDELLETTRPAGLIMLRRVTESLAARLESERSRLLEAADSDAAQPGRLPDPIAPSDSPWSAAELPRIHLRHCMTFSPTRRCSKASNHALLDWLSHQASVQAFAKDDELFSQGGIADYLYLLVDGRIGFSYCDAAGERCVFLRALEGVGDPIGWSALVDPRRYRTSAFALEATHVLAIPSPSLEKLCEQEPAFGLRVMRRLLHAISSRLRFTRVRLVARRYGEEAHAMRTILDQAAESPAGHFGAAQDPAPARKSPDPVRRLSRARADPCPRQSG